MKNDIQMPDFNLPSKVKLFFNTAAAVFGIVLFVHFVGVSIYAFAYYDKSLVVSGFDFGEWRVVGRCLILIPYLLLPVTYAACKVAGFSLTDARNTLQTITKLRGQADVSKGK